MIQGDSLSRRDQGGGEITRRTSENLKARGKTWQKFLLLFATKEKKELKHEKDY